MMQTKIKAINLKIKEKTQRCFFVVEVLNVE